MRKTITVKWLNKINACSLGIKCFKEQGEKEPIAVLKKLVTEGKLDWTNWLIVRLMTYKQYVSYAVYAAEQVIDIYEKKYPDDKRPREAIEAAKRCIENPSEKNKNAADAYAAAYAAAADAAASATDAAYAAAAAVKKKIVKYGIRLLEGE